MEINHPVNHRSKKLVDCRTARLADILTKYYCLVSKNIAKIEKQTTAQIKPHTFNSFDPMSIIGFLKNFKLACDTDGVHEGASMWLLHFVVNKTASAVVNTRLSAEHTDERHSR